MSSNYSRPRKRSLRADRAGRLISRRSSVRGWSVVGALAIALAVPLFCPAVAAPCVDDALGVSRTLPVGAGEAGLAIGLKSYPRTLDLAPGEVVLTFDDGPNGATTPAVLDALKRACVKATFFLIGRNAAAHPALVKREIEEGHTVGHHSFSHPAVTMRGLGDAAAQADIARGFAADDQAAYGEANGAPRTPFFRYPGFADTPGLNAWLASRRIVVFGADLWASDWVDMSPQATLDLLMRRLEAAGKGVILLHDARAQTAAMMPDLLRALKQRGFRIVHLTPGDAPPPLTAAGPQWTSETERAIAKTWPKIMASQRAATAGARHPQPIAPPAPQTQSGAPDRAPL